MSFVFSYDQGAVPCHLFCFVLCCFNKLLHWLVQFCKRIIFFSKQCQTLPMRECCLAFCCCIFITICGYSSPVLPVVKFTLRVGLHNASKPFNCFRQSLCHIPCTFCLLWYHEFCCVCVAVCLNGFPVYLQPVWPCYRRTQEMLIWNI